MSSFKRIGLIAVLFVMVCTANVAFAQAKISAQDAPVAYNVKENYTKYDYKIPMRDGKKLFTAVYVPKDSSRTHPIMMTRTPYSLKPYGVDQ